MTRTLIFFDRKTKETWVHSQDDWILTYCNFETPIHPMLLRVGQTVEGRDKDGNTIEISCVRREP